MGSISSSLRVSISLHIPYRIIPSKRGSLDPIWHNAFDHAYQAYPISMDMTLIRGIYPIPREPQIPYTISAHISPPDMDPIKPT